MSNSVELEIGDVKFRSNGAARDWYASAHVVATDLDGRKAEGWVHVVKNGAALKIENFDEYDDRDPELLGYAIATRGESIIAAIEARAALAAVAA